MARTDNLTNFLTDVAKSIKDKKGDQTNIPAKDFDSEIANLPSSGENPYAYSKFLSDVLWRAVVPDGSSFTYDVPNLTRINQMIGNCKGEIDTIKIITKKDDSVSIQMSNAFQPAQGGHIKTIDFSEMKKRIDNAFYGFNNQYLVNILGDLDFSNASNLQGVFTGCLELVQVRLKSNSLSISISFGASSKLSQDSINSIINGLATITTAQTITFNKDIVLSDEQKSQIQAKGWTLAQ